EHEIHGLFERRRATVVEIGRVTGNGSHRRRLERALVFGVVRDLAPTYVRLGFVVANADVVETVVGEERRRMAGGAPRFVAEEIPAPYRVLSHGLFVAFLVFVPGRFSTPYGPHECGDGLDDAVGRGVAVEHGLELNRVAGDLRDGRRDLRGVGAHLSLP